MASGGDQHITTTKAVLFTAKVKILTITEDQSTIDQQECSHVMVERHENDEHKIVVLNQITEEEKTEVFSCCIHGNMQLVHSEENIVKWTAGSGNLPTYNLIFEDITKIENLLSTINSLLKSTPSVFQTNSLDSQLVSENIVAKEEKVDQSMHSAMAVEKISHDVDLFTAQTKESTTHLVVQKSMVFEESVAQFNIPEADTGVETESENVTTHSEPHVPTDDLPDTSAPEESSKIVAESGNEAVNAINENELQCSEVDSEPIVPITSTPSHAVNLPRPDLRSRSREDMRSIPSADLYMECSSNAVLYYNSSRGVEEGLEQMKLTETVEKKCVDAMVNCYQKMIQVYEYETDNTTKISNKKIHKHLAALICHQEKRSPYAALLCTGTLHKDNEVCGHEGSHGTCDGHAESIIYEAAPKYFMNEMDIVLKEEGNESIFEILPNNRGFKLKPNIKFYLMVTEPPCGFIENQEDPCMEWKTPFVGFPHVPTCSSRILIGATMGIQGYVSHLLEEPIMIDSVIILCSKGAELIKTDFGSSFPLPSIKTRGYNPRQFANFEPDHSAKARSLPINFAVPSTFSENTGTTIRSNSFGSEQHSDSSVTLTGTDRNLGTSFLTFNPRTGKQKSRISGFLITRDVNERIAAIDKVVEMERKASVKNIYTDLCKRLELERALVKLQDKLRNAIGTKCNKVSSMIDLASTALRNRTLNTLDEFLQLAGALDKTAVTQKWIEHSKSIKEKVDTIEEEGTEMIENQAMIMCIENTLSKHKVIMDCSWHSYLFKLPDDNQPTD